MAATEERNTNRLLGYPDEARLLIINADDFGMCHAVNAATMAVLTTGVATSTSLMTPCPWALEAMQWLAAHPEIPFGVHLTLVSDFANCRWGPVAAKDQVPSLIEPTGYFYPYDQIPDLLAQAKVDEVEREFRAQIETVLAAQLTPSHLDFHCIADGGRDDIFELTVALAKEYGLALRVHAPEHAAQCQQAGLPCNDHGVLDSYRLEPAEKADRYRELIQALPPGLSEWAVHPSLGDAEAQALEPATWQVRRADFDFFTAPEARELLAAEGIVLLDYRPLQQVWAG